MRSVENPAVRRSVAVSVLFEGSGRLSSSMTSFCFL